MNIKKVLKGSKDNILRSSPPPHIKTRWGYRWVYAQIWKGYRDSQVKVIKVNQSSLNIGDRPQQRDNHRS